ncbi:D-alanyl-D-alanine carboxypeptidase [Alkalibacillus flavidus]|uniref:D-alanyl-D-alanine carboxypeptidase n=1 Tax=Alkalibacillus flavidus TaxID=546021 RepID=A0ABV2KTJ9_9BACI
MNFWLIVIIILIPTIFAVLAKTIKSFDNKKTEHDVLKFIKNNPDKASLFAIQNNNVILEYQAGKKMPLASTLKVIIAIEFARQTDAKEIDPQHLVPLKDLDKYFIPYSDGGAHKDWINSLGEDNHNSKDRVTLLQIAKGMMQFSSNANTEFLIGELGLNRINHTIKSLSLHEHDSLFPISSANLICTYLQLENGNTFNQALKRIKEMTCEEYIEKATKINELLGSDKDKSLITKLSSKDIFNTQLQVVLSQKQPKSTTQEYATLMNAIRKKEILTSNAHDTLYEIMNVVPNSNSPLVDLGLKGGSSISILTTAFYSKDKYGNTIDMAIFIHDPSRLEILWLKNKFDLFIGKFTTNKDFRSEVIKALMVK